MLKTAFGLITAGVGGLYTVLLDEACDGMETVACRAKGAFRHAEQKPLVGDRVEVRYDDANPAETAVIREILARKNALIRPPMANVTHLFAAVAAARPAPSLETLDKLTAIATHNSIDLTFVITKSDLDKENTKRLADLYRLSGFSVFETGLDEKEADDLIKEKIDSLPEGSIVAFAGASGVGKSTLLNRLFPHLCLHTGEVSQKIMRGKHTTRRVDLFCAENKDGKPFFLADTPGFSLLDFTAFDFFALEDLFDSFPDFAPYAGLCRYSDCTHTGEGPEECAIAKAVREEKVASSRQESYRTLYRILKEKKNKF